MKREERIFLAYDGKVRTVQTGFSWIAFFWTPVFPALFNRDWKWLGITLIVFGLVYWLASAEIQSGRVLYAIYMLFFAFMYHSMYEKGLRKAGWSDATSEEIEKATRGG